MIKVALGLDATDLKKGKKEVDNTFRDMASSAKSSFGSIAGALGLGLSAAGTVQFLRETANELDEVGKAARRANVNSTDYQVLAEAFRMGAGSAEELSISLTKVQQLMGMAGRGDERATGIFSRMGIDFRDLAGLAPDKLLETIAKRIMEIEDGNERTTASVEIFGEKGMKTVEILSAGLASLKAEMETSGRLFDADSIKAAEEYNDSISKLWRSFQSLATAMGVVKGMSWVAGVVEGAAQLPGQVQKAQKAGATGMYANTQDQVVTFVADFLSFGLASKITDKFGSSTKPLISVPANPDGTNLVDQHQLNQVVDPGGADRKRQKAQDEAAAAQKRYTEQLRREAAARSEVDKMLAPLAFSREETAQAATDQAAAEKLLPEIFKAVAKTGYQMTEQDKEAIKNRVKLTYETLRAAQAQEKFEKSLKGSLQPMREQLLTSLGMGRQAERERAERELRAAKGRELSEEEKKQARELGDLRYGTGQIGANRQQLDTSIRSNELSELGGAYNLVVTPDADSITAGIAQDTAAMREMLDRIQQRLDKLGIVGG